MSNTATTTAGTVQVGRWTYPAQKRQGVDFTAIVRNSKRDGTGEDVLVESDKVANSFVPDVAPEVDLDLRDLSPYDRAMLAQIGNSQGKRPGDSFDFFDDGIVEHSGIWFAHAADQTENPAVAKRAFKSLANKGYLEIGEMDRTNKDYPDRWMSLTAKGALAAVALAGESTDLPAPGAKPESAAKAEGEPCRCGCGEIASAKRLYLPGHDARHAGQVARAIIAEPNRKHALLATLPTPALRTKAANMVDRRS